MMGTFHPIDADLDGDFQLEYEPRCSKECPCHFLEVLTYLRVACRPSALKWSVHSDFPPDCCKNCRPVVRPPHAQSIDSLQLAIFNLHFSIFNCRHVVSVS